MSSHLAPRVMESRRTRQETEGCSPIHCGEHRDRSTLQLQERKVGKVRTCFCTVSPTPILDNAEIGTENNKEEKDSDPI